MFDDTGSEEAEDAEAVVDVDDDDVGRDSQERKGLIHGWGARHDAVAAPMDPHHHRCVGRLRQSHKS